jgi:hypothetical protein
MNLTTRRLFQLAFGLLATTLPAFCIPAGGPCVAVTPEPSYFWVMGAGAGAILMLRRIRSKK